MGGGKVEEGSGGEGAKGEKKRRVEGVGDEGFLKLKLGV